jgi:hypothetical protein
MWTLTHPLESALWTHCGYAADNKSRLPRAARHGLERAGLSTAPRSGQFFFWQGRHSPPPIPDPPAGFPESGRGHWSLGLLGAGVIHLAAICDAFFEIGLHRSPASLGATRGGVSRFARRICRVGKRLALPGDLNSHRCCAFHGCRPERNANRRGEQALTPQTADHGVLQTFELPMIFPIRFSGKIVRPKCRLSH